MNGLSYLMFVTDKQHKEVADECKVSSQMITNWVRGTKPISEKHIPKLASYFSVEEKYINKEITLQDKIEMELQLASKTGEYVNMDYQAGQLHRRNQAMQEKYFALLEVVEDYAKTFDGIHEVMNEFHKEMMGLLEIESLINDPEGCMKVYDVLKKMQIIRKQTMPREDVNDIERRI